MFIVNWLKMELVEDGVINIMMSSDRFVSLPPDVGWWYVESTWKFAALLGVLRGIFFLYPGISFLSVCTYV